jgi:hypothetical protein
LVNQQVATATDVNETLLASLVVIIGDALRLDHVAIELPSAANGWTRVAGRGAPSEHDENFPLALGDQLVGRLVVGCRSAALGRLDRAVLADVVPHVTLAVALVRLTGDLRRSRLSAVNAREEERRRLRTARRCRPVADRDIDGAADCRAKVASDGCAGRRRRVAG